MSHMQEAARPRKSLALNWPAAFSLLTAFVAAGTVMLHLIGDIRHRLYLQHWGIEPDLFPKTADWILINGYYGTVDRFIAILAAILSNLHWLAAAVVILGVYVFALLSPSLRTSKETPAWLSRRPEWQRRFVRQLLLTAIFVGATPAALFLLTAFMVIPAALGEAAGKSAAEYAAAEYRKGCDISRIACIELKREGETIATGFVLDISSSHIAIFDAHLQRGRVLAAEKLEIVARKVPGSGAP